MGIYLHTKDELISAYDKWNHITYALLANLGVCVTSLILFDGLNSIWDWCSPDIMNTILLIGIIVAVWNVIFLCYAWDTRWDTAYDLQHENWSKDDDSSVKKGG